MATIRDVAELAEVSVATVSRVLNNNGEVSEEKTKRVKQAAKKLGYTIAHPSASKRTTVLALLPNSVKDFYDDIIKGIQYVTKKEGFDLIIGVCNNNRFVEAEHIEKLIDGSVSAIILFGSFLRSEEIEDLNKKYNVAVCCECIEGASVLSVVVDMRQAAYDAVTHLIKKGHRNIGLISTVTRAWSTIEKEKGYRKALLDNGLEYREEYIFFGDFDNKSGIFSLGYFDSLDTPPTAIFAVSDNLALGAIKAAINKGLNVGEDIAVIGFDDTLLCSLYNPSISSVTQPRYEIGKTVMERLADNINGKKKCTDTIYLPHTLSLRKSSGD